MSSAAVIGSAPRGIRELELPIREMTRAAACAEKKLSARDDVLPTVNSATQKATVTASAPIRAAMLRKQIEPAGHGR